MLMRLPWVTCAIVMVAAILTHEGVMAANGHEPLARATIDGSHENHATAHHHGAGHDTDPAPAPGELPQPCVIYRQVVTLNQQMTPALDDAPVGILPIALESSQFTATSRDLVTTPPAHPPDLDRAYFQVYRI